MPEALDTVRSQLSELVRCPSVSAVDAEFDMSNAEIVDLLSAWFSDAGFGVEQQEVAASPLKRNFLGNLGPPPAAADGGLVLSGHTDTVPYDAGRWDSDPFVLREADGRWYGLGSADMKCFFPIVLAALQGIDRATITRPLQVLGTADEESSMAGARIVAESGAALGRYALIGEPTELVPIIKHKGILIGRIEFVGRSGHSSVPAAGRNALDAMHALITRLIEWREAAAANHRDSEFDVPGPTLNLGRISGGDSPNRICAQCELLFDIRLMPGMSVADIEHDMRTMVAAVASAHDLDGAFVLPMPALAAMETPASSALASELINLSGNPATTVAFATEGPFLNALGCESVIFGPGNIATAHQPNEYVEIERVERMIGILRELIVRFCCSG